MRDISGLVIDERQHSHVLQQPLATTRGGIMLHDDDSSRDDWAVEWCNDPRCTNGSTWLVLDDGRVVGPDGSTFRRSPDHRPWLDEETYSPSSAVDT